MQLARGQARMSLDMPGAGAYLLFCAAVRRGPVLHQAHQPRKDACQRWARNARHRRQRHSDACRCTARWLVCEANVLHLNAHSITLAYMSLRSCAGARGHNRRHPPTFDGRPLVAEHALGGAGQVGAAVHRRECGQVRLEVRLQRGGLLCGTMRASGAVLAMFSC